MGPAWSTDGKIAFTSKDVNENSPSSEGPLRVSGGIRTHGLLGHNQMP